MSSQRTIKEKITFEGVGLHTGEKTKFEIIPAPVNSGVVFARQDIALSSIIRADISSIVSPDKFLRRTCIGRDGACVHTIEHLMAALFLTGIDNVRINVWGSEIPGMDGSAKEFIEKINQVGTQEQDAWRSYLVVKEPLWIEDGLSSIVALPNDKLRISYSLNYNNPVIGTSYIDLILDDDLDDDFYHARTFCLEDEVKSLLDSGLGKGSNYKNTLVVSKTGVVDNEVRFNDEFAKHKVLDLIGDLYLSGRVKGHIIALRSGHQQNLKMVKKLKKYRQNKESEIIPKENYVLPEGENVDIRAIMDTIPHRYPFLLVDRIVHLESGYKAIGIKNVTMNEHFFQGHFPKRPVMPGVLMIEAMAQVGGVLTLSCPQHRGKLAFFMAVDNVKFRKIVVPGDQLIMEVNVGKIRSKTGLFYGRATVDGKCVCEADLKFAFVD